MTALIIIGIVVIVFVVWAIIAYNSLIKKRNRVEEANSNVLIQLQRRFDLIPNLLETVKGYAKHESETLTRVAELREKSRSVQGALDNAQGVGSVDSVRNADEAVSELTKQSGTFINAVAESYPDLKASANFQQLQEELATTENKVAFARQNANDTIVNFNNSVESFPSSLIAKMFGFKRTETFNAPEEVHTVPKISF